MGVAARPVVAAYRALGLGDFLTGVPALRALARAFPDHRRVLCAPAALGPLAELSGAVDETLDTAPLAVPRLVGPAVAVNLHGRGPQSHEALHGTRPGRLIAFRCRAAHHPEGPAWREDEHEVSRWCRLLAESGIPADPSDLRLARPPWAPPSGAAGATVVHPGAASGARRWPVERFAAVARAEHAAGRRVIVTGGPAERELAARVAQLAALPGAAATAGQTGLRDLAAIVAAAGRVVCGDTGVAHLATAFGSPSVVVFGPTAPARWGPPPDDPAHVALWAGRTGDPHADTVDPGMLEIGVTDVLSALARLPR